jgi:hypothetical protein
LEDSGASVDLEGNVSYLIRPRRPQLISPLGK